MSKNSLNLRVLVTACAAFAGCRAVHANNESDVKFIGGDAVNEGEYPASVYFQHCTAAKIGSKQFLMAAHCLYQNELSRPSFEMVPGSKASILVGISLEKGKLEPVTITSATGYPGFDYATLMKDYVKLAPDAATPQAEVAPTSVDLALVTVAEDTPELPVVTFDDAPLVVGQTVTIGGYGCEQETEEANPLMRLKYAQIPLALAKGALVSWRAQSEADGYRSTCHGDSGGPVYRTVGGEKKIVGVNSGSPKGYSVFTALSGPAGAKGLAWVKQQMAVPVTEEAMTFKAMACNDAMAASPSADGIQRSYQFSDLKLAVKDGGKIHASIDKFKVTIKPDGSSMLQPYALTVAEAAGCEPGVLCYKVVYTEPSTATKKLLAVQMKAGKMSVYEGEPVEGVTPLGVALDPRTCTLSDAVE